MSVYTWKGIWIRYSVFFIHKIDIECPPQVALCWCWCRAEPTWRATLVKEIHGNLMYSHSDGCREAGWGRRLCQPTKGHPMEGAGGSGSLLYRSDLWVEIWSVAVTQLKERGGRMVFCAEHNSFEMEQGPCTYVRTTVWHSLDNYSSGVTIISPAPTLYLVNISYLSSFYEQTPDQAWRTQGRHGICDSLFLALSWTDAYGMLTT